MAQRPSLYISESIQKKLDQKPFSPSQQFQSENFNDNQPTNPQDVTISSETQSEDMIPQMQVQKNGLNDYQLSNKQVGGATITTNSVKDVGYKSPSNLESSSFTKSIENRYSTIQNLGFDYQYSYLPHNETQYQLSEQKKSISYLPHNETSYQFSEQKKSIVTDQKQSMVSVQSQPRKSQYYQQVNVFDNVPTTTHQIEYEARIDYLNSEIERLRKNNSSEQQVNELNVRIRELVLQCQQKDQKNLELSQKLTDIQNINQKELERLRTLLSGADIENKELKIKIDGFELSKREKQNIEYENVRFRELIEKQTKQLEYSSNDAKFFEQRSKESEKRLTLMTQEVEKLNDLIRLRIREYDEIKLKLHAIEGDQSIKQVRYTDEIMSYKSQLEQSEKKKSDLQNQFQNATSRNFDLESRVKNLLSENEAYKNLANQLENQLQELKKSIQNQYEVKSSLLTQEIERLNILLKSKISDAEEMRKRIYILTEEIERSKNVITQRTDENDELLREIQQLRHQLQNSQDFKRKYDELMKQFKELKEILEIYQEKEREDEQKYKSQTVYVQKTKSRKSLAPPMENRQWKF